MKSRKTPSRNTPAQTLPDELSHGGLRRPTVTIQGYSLQLHDGDGFAGDSVSRRAYGEMLDAWRKLYRRISGLDPLGRKPTADISKKRLDTLLSRNGKAAAIIAAASEDYAWQLARVVRRFLAHPSWQGVRRIVVGGGFRQSLVGELAIDRAAELLYQRGSRAHLMTLRHHPDEGGLIGWVHLAPPEVLSGYDGFLAVDIGGTKVAVCLAQDRERLPHAALFSCSSVSPGLTRVNSTGRVAAANAPSRRSFVFAAMPGTSPRRTSASTSMQFVRMISRAASVFADASSILICVLCKSPILARLYVEARCRAIST
mgnify:CR=1 FL=1